MNLYPCPFVILFVLFAIVRPQAVDTVMAMSEVINLRNFVIAVGCHDTAFETLDVSTQTLTCLIADPIINCNAAGRIIKLIWVLPQTPLNGSFVASSIATLSSLTSLVIRFSTTKGSLDGIERLSNLEELVLDYNSLNGTIPTTIGLLSKLRILAIAGNNNITGKLPSEIGNLRTSLTSLDLGELDKLDHILPNEFFQLNRLSRIAMHSCGFLGSVSRFNTVTFPTMNTLIINGNQFTGLLPSIPPSIAQPNCILGGMFVFPFRSMFNFSLSQYKNVSTPYRNCFSDKVCPSNCRCGGDLDNCGGASETLTIATSLKTLVLNFTSSTTFMTSTTTMSLATSTDAIPISTFGSTPTPLFASPSSSSSSPSNSYTAIVESNSQFLSSIGWICIVVGGVLCGLLIGAAAAYAVRRSIMNRSKSTTMNTLSTDANDRSSPSSHYSIAPSLPPNDYNKYVDANFVSIKELNDEIGRAMNAESEIQY